MLALAGSSVRVLFLIACCVSMWLQVANPAGCDGLAVTVRSEADLNKYMNDAKFKAATEVGAVTIAWSKITAIQLEKLLDGKTKIDGGLVIENAPELTAINLPTIETITGELEFLTLPKVEKVVVDSLVTVGSLLKIQSLGSATEIDLSSLETVTQSFTIYNCMKLTTLDLSSLSKAGTRTDFTNLGLKELTLPSLVTVITLSMTNINQATTVSLPALKTVSYYLGINGGRALVRLSAPVLESVSTFSLRSVSKLTSLCEVAVKASGIKRSIGFSDAMKLVKGDAELMKKAKVCLVPKPASVCFRPLCTHFCSLVISLSSPCRQLLQHDDNLLCWW